MTALLSVEDIFAGYQSGVDILQGLSLEVLPGTVTLVIGPNGAGKSTLLRTIFGLLKAHRGTIGLRATILLVDQNIEDAIAQADRVYMVNLGRVKAEGPAAEFGAERVRTLIQECLLG